MKKYYGIDWLRVLACIGIMVMHVCKNSGYEISGFVYGRMIPSFTDFVFLFMAISAFGMCCGYFDKVTSGKIRWTDFYKKRYTKVLPFFLLLIIIDLVLDFGIPSLCEGFTEATLLHGFVPHSFSVIGVGWFLGVVFIFYLIFPFFCVLIETKSRAWCAFAISVILNYICTAYFNVSRSNFLYSFCFFIAGGLVYLYKDALQKIKWFFYLPVIALAAACYYLLGANVLTRLAVTVALLIFAIAVNCGKVRVIALLSDISMECYLSHMVVFRVIEKLHLNTMFGKGWLQFLITALLVLAGTAVFSWCCHMAIQKMQNLVKSRKSA